MNLGTFLSEIILRLFAKTPSFFKWVRNISLVLTVLIGLPAFLQESGIVLPEYWAAISNKVVGIATIVAAFIAQLTATPEEKEEKGIQ
mgnify:CR=1 FL=1|jgi:hypothetical protein